MAKWLHDTRAQIMPKVFELVGASCIVKFKDVGEQHGIIESISTPVIGDDLDQSINASQFRIHLQSGDVVTVPGSQISAIRGRTRAS